MDKIEDINKINHSLLDWQRDALAAFKHKIMDKNALFPCIPAIQGYNLKQMKLAFANDPRTAETAAELAVLLTKYGNCSRDIGEYTALIVLFETPEELKTKFTVRAFEQVFWELLNQVSILDTEEWPDSISADPVDPTWEFCFNKERYFMYCATPAHRKRKSRYFPFFMLAITPRWVLEKYSSNPEKAEKMKALIRKRMYEYDEVPPHPDLKWYGEEDNHEWKQYFLRDDETSLSACPFHHMVENKE